MLLLSFIKHYGIDIACKMNRKQWQLGIASCFKLIFTFFLTPEKQRD